MLAQNTAECNCSISADVYEMDLITRKIKKVDTVFDGDLIASYDLLSEDTPENCKDLTREFAYSDVCLKYTVYPVLGDSIADIPRDTYYEMQRETIEFYRKVDKYKIEY